MQENSAIIHDNKPKQPDHYYYMDLSPLTTFDQEAMLVLLNSSRPFEALHMVQIIINKASERINKN